ncbi:hypothetical protein [Paramuribaculum intestinale]|uniref:hypothetical protein n=1 Tax=Paramuribaculum intestinale TaxID=2094151 RepID=UPI003220341D
MTRLLTCIVIMLLTVIIPARADEPKLSLKGNVYEATFGAGLINAKVYLLDSLGVAIDSTKTGRTSTNVNGQWKRQPDFELKVPRTPAHYTIEVNYKGFEPGFQSVTIGKLGSRETERGLPDITLRREAKKLDEVTVTATKVKFYNSGDTLVYNADAFMLAEGSMLDALIQQLPGVELKDDGRIFVNGKYVESLLLNGRQFMDNNNRLLLDNLGAYTVKDIAVYDKLSDRSLFLGQDKDNGETRYVMDVRMKKEFMGSYIANVEAGYGSADRYLGRFFLSRSDTRTQYVLFGNINNLNDRRRPGQSSNWTPEDLESGLRREKTIGGQYEVTQSGSNPWKFNGNFSLNHTSQDDETFTDRTNFLPGGNTYNYTFNNLRNRNLNFNTFHSTHKQTRRIFFSAKVSGRINRSDYRQSVVSGTFADRQESVTRQWLADIYATGSEATLSSIINRSIQTDSMRNNLWSVNGDASITYKFSQNPDNMYIWVKGGYTGQTPDRYNDQRINFGSSPAAERTMQIFRNHPAHEYYIKPIFSYCYNFSDNGNIQPEYTFTYTHRRNDSRLFNPEDPAADMTFDAPMSLDQANSYYQLDKTLTHTVGFRSSQVFRGDGHFWRIMLGPTLGFNTQHLDYTQAGQAIRKTRHSMQFTDSWTEVKYGFGAYSNRWGGKDYRNMLILKFESQAQMPDMRYLVDIPNTSDPLTILLGAPSLKNQHDLQWKLRYELTPQNGRIMEAAQIYYRLLTNALVRGYSYDTRTGVRTIRSYNTSGNWETGAMNSFMLPLDKARKLTLAATSEVKYGHATDVIGTDDQAPAPFTVRNLVGSQRLRLTWGAAEWLNLTGKANLQLRHTSSERPDFSNIDAFDANYGVVATVKFTKNFSLSTDMTLFTRNGYDTPVMNNSDWVWNARLAYTFDRGRWTLMLDGFDLLRQLNSVQYAVNAQGRTVRYVNTLPRFFLFHAQYKINIMPKKRK